MKRVMIWAVSLMMAASAGGAAAAPRPDAQADKGWVRLFDGESGFGWQARGDARWSAAGGEITPVRGTGRGFLATTSPWADYELEVDFWCDDVVNSGVFLRCPSEGEINSRNAYEVNIYDRHDQYPTGSINDHRRAYDAARTQFRWNRYRIRAAGDRVTVTLNDQRMVDLHDGSHRQGPIALQYNGEGLVRFRNIRLRPLRLETLFNGKNLDGWKEIPGRKSVYSVTPEGWLNVKDGNGDLQSTRTFGDFVLQLDIFTNGTHLNSGVFFRGDAGAFWSGYESQIRNQWKGDDRTQPVDFGTGGIYNLQPARRVVSDDRKWFTMTVNAWRNHFAVWIDGVQVSDFTDLRAPDSNARKGYRAAPGVLSLQGHDPTTDISFRRIRAGELPAGR